MFFSSKIPLYNRQLLDLFVFKCVVFSIFEYFGPWNLKKPAVSILFHFQGSKTVKQNWKMKGNWVGTVVIKNWLSFCSCGLRWWKPRYCDWLAFWCICFLSLRNRNESGTAFSGTFVRFIHPRVSTLVSLHPFDLSIFSIWPFTSKWSSCYLRIQCKLLNTPLRSSFFEIIRL